MYCGVRPSKRSPVSDNLPKMSDRDRASTASPSLMEAGLKTLIGGRDSNYPLISGINGKLVLENGDILTCVRPIRK